MPQTIKLRRGTKANLPSLAVGEPAFATDTGELFVGNSGGNVQIGGGKRFATFVVGLSTSGYTAADVDYLCDGAADQVEINAALAALPATGGKVLLLEGTYNITASITIPKDNVTLEGMGAATKLVRGWDGTAYTDSVLYINAAENCKLSALLVDGSKSLYASSSSCGVYISTTGIGINIESITSNNNAYAGIMSGGYSVSISGCMCGNNNYGIHADGYNSTTVGNICNNNNYGISVNDGAAKNNSTVSGNTCNNNTTAGIVIEVNGGKGVVTGNTCNGNDGGIYVRGEYTSIVGNVCFDNTTYGIYTTGHNHSIVGNTCVKGSGQAADYTSAQYTIRVTGRNNLVSSNLVLGKDVTNSGTNNTLVDNKAA